MFLSRITLDLDGRTARRDLGDSQALHRSVMSGFPADGPPDGVRAAFGVLHRVDWDERRKQAYLLVQSAIAPDWGRLPAGLAVGSPLVKPLEPMVMALAAGQRLGFRLRANPTRKIGTVPKGRREVGGGGNGQRVPLREEEWGAWLARKATESGFQVVQVEARRDLLAPGGFRGGGGTRARLTHRGVVFDGELVIEDIGRFRDALRSGIGPAKAYGFGLLSLVPAGALR